jgi:hypothetical protein
MRKEDEMMKPLRVMALALAAMVFSSAAAAQGFDLKRLFFGGGVSLNSASGADDGTGFQIFGGYNFPRIAPNLYVDVEAGYMDTGNLDLRACGPGPCDAKANGPWTTGVIRYLVTPKVELIGRAGYDFGDDDGPMVGIGVGFIVSPQLKLRAEYVARDNVDSLQFNVVFYLW